MQARVIDLNDGQLLANYTTLSYKWLKSNDNDLFDLVTEYRHEILRRMKLGAK